MPKIKLSKATLILRNAQVLTMEMFRPRASLVAIKGDRISWVGSEADLDMLVGPGTRTIDCQDKAITPGFFDAHLHLFSLASARVSVDCSPERVGSIADIKRAIQRKAAGLPAGAWVRAAGYNQFYLAEKRHPTRFDLDEAAPAHPVKLMHRSGHVCVLNTLALQKADLLDRHPALAGQIERDPQTSEPTGVLYEMEAYLSRALGYILSEAEVRDGLRQVGQRLLELGVTSVEDTTPINALAQFETLQQMVASGVRLPRIAKMFGADALPELRRHGLMFGSDAGGVTIGAIKLMLDENSGRMFPPPDMVKAMALEAHQAGFQVAFHAMEEPDIAVSVEALHFALDQSPTMHHRHRLEHCAVCPPDLLAQVKRLMPVIVTQPGFVYQHGERYQATVPADQQPWLYQARAFLDGGLIVAAGSDAPFGPEDPMKSLYGAVTRRTAVGTFLGPGEALSVEEALALHTSKAAYACFQEANRGSIAPGKLADLALLSGDPTAIPAESLKDLRVDLTVLGGQVVWDRRGMAT